MTITYVQLRQLFSQFWREKNHKEIPPIPLVPKDDPTTLFTGSGMQQLVPYLLGESHPLGTRLYNIQPCFRSQDIEEVGDNHHTTFFEMFGNWSLGDYFKEEQLKWFWQFLTKELQLPKNKLFVTVFTGNNDLPADDETLSIWKKLGIPENKIFKYGSGNWWSRAGAPENMPAGEPGGPDSEVFYDFGEELKLHEQSKFKNQKCHPNCDCGRFMEIGNSVFMQYKKVTDSTFQELPKKNVDFGGGFERMMMAIENRSDIFITTLYQPIIQEIEKITNQSYRIEKNKQPIRIIADHIKASIFLIKDGIVPSNKEQGYVLRRLLRRLILKYKNLTGQLPISSNFGQIIKVILTLYEGIYFESKKDYLLIDKTIEEEIKRFNLSLEKGLKLIDHIDKINGKVAFDFYQNFGIPLELTEEIFLEKGQKIDKKQFHQEFEKHKNISRKASVAKFKGGLADQSKQVLKYHTATHLLHQALFDVLGNEIHQEGSNITTERLRFDFYAIKKPTEEEIRKVESIINSNIKRELELLCKILPKIDADKIGAKSFFREKYPDMVKVFFIGDYSKEFCGGPHVKNTKEIGAIKIFKFEKIGSNLYRIYAN